MILKKLSALGSMAVIIVLAAPLVSSAQTFTGAPTVCEKTKTKTKTKTPSAYKKALAAYSRGDYRKAAGLLEREVKERPEAGSYYLLGYASYKLGNRKTAKRYFKEAYLIDPGLNPGNIIFQIRKTKKAERHGRTRQ